MNFEASEKFARSCDDNDPLAALRSQFAIPKTKSGDDAIYLCGNSLGLMPRHTRTLVMQELADWEKYAVDGHLEAQTPWYSYHEVFRETGARLVGAKPGEVVMMNSLTTNLHLMMTSFYRPTPKRYKIIIDANTFPSDTYAAASQIALHGYDPKEALLPLPLRAGEHTHRPEDITAFLAKHGESVALVMMSGVHYFTGQLFDIEKITREANAQGCMVGFDLAHAAGNAVLKLHDWNVDFAAWCSYKYLNSGPGAVAGCFVHEKHGNDTSIKRMAGWWGNDPKTRFRMHETTTFIARPGADGWQLSNPPILAMAPLRASLAMFDQATMPTLRKKSEAMTGYLSFLLHELSGKGTKGFEVITPAEPSARGCQMSLRVLGDAQKVHAALHEQGVIADFRTPDVIRVAPVPMYNSFTDVWRFGEKFVRAVSAAAS